MGNQWVLCQKERGSIGYVKGGEGLGLAEIRQGG